MRLNDPVVPPAHPSLRWVTLSDGMQAAHRAISPEVSRCGLTGPFILAGNSKDRCVACFPQQQPARNVKVRR